ncbi:MAG: SurA N-terminal domain-containing protein [Acidimicrobiales bacterium]
MRRLRLPLALLAALALLLAACGDDDDADAGSNGETASEIDLDELESGELPPLPEFVEPEDGVAARVGGVEIPVEQIESIVSELTDLPEVAEQLDTPEGEYYLAELRSQILNQFVIQQVIIQGAATDFGIELTDDALAEAEAELVEEFGGQEAFDAELAAAGMSVETFRSLELPLAAITLLLEEEFGDLTLPDDAEPGTMTPGVEQLQAWGQEKMSAADVEVAESYGTWNAEFGQIQPLGTPQFSLE